jgi:hypothetical protein
MLTERIKQLVFELRLPGKLTRQALSEIAEDVRKRLVEMYNEPNLDPVRKGHIQKACHFLIRGCYMEGKYSQAETANALEAILECFKDKRRDPNDEISRGELLKLEDITSQALTNRIKQMGHPGPIRKEGRKEWFSMSEVDAWLKSQKKTR